MPKPLAMKTLIKRTVASQEQGEKYAKQNGKQMSRNNRAADPFADKLAVGNMTHWVEKLEGNHRADYDMDGANEIIQDLYK